MPDAMTVRLRPCRGGDASANIMTLTAKLEPGAPFACRLEWSGGERRLLVDWQKDAPAPAPFGRFDPPVADAG